MYLIFTFREFKSIRKGKTAILHLRFGIEKNRRLGSKKARYNRAFRKRHLFCLNIMANDSNFDRKPLRGCNYGLEGGAFLILGGAVLHLGGAVFCRLHPLQNHRKSHLH